MNISDKIYIAGSNGMVGSAISRQLKDAGYTNIITCKYWYSLETHHYIRQLRKEIQRQ
jgi:nucleoside-diphosphate-sugar epimerase